MRFRGLVLALALGSGLSLAADAPTLPPEGLVRLLREARIQGGYGKIDEARELYWQALEEYPDQLAPLVELNSFHAKHPLTDEDVARFRALLETRLLDADFPLPYSLLRKMVQDPDVSEADLSLSERALKIRLAPGDEDARLLDALALVQLRLERPEDARQTLARLLKAEPSGAVFWRCIYLDMKLERWDSALDLLDKALAERGEDIWARTLRLDLLAKTGQVDQLLDEIATIEVKELPLSVADSLVEAAWVFRDRRQDDDAERLFRAALEVHPGHEVAKAALLHLYATPEERAAHAASLGSRRNETEYADELISEGAARLASGDAATAYDLLTQATKILPEEELAWLNLGIAAIRLKRWTEAAGALERAAEINPDRPETLASLGETYSETGRCEEAIALLEHAIEVRPDFPPAHYYLYLCFKEMGDPRAVEALATYTKLLDR